jgi:hypothetical protein
MLTHVYKLVFILSLRTLTHISYLTSRAMSQTMGFIPRVRFWGGGSDDCTASSVWGHLPHISIPEIFPVEFPAKHTTRNNF